MPYQKKSKSVGVDHEIKNLGFTRFFEIPQGLILWPEENNFTKIRDAIFSARHLFDEVVPGRDSIGILSAKPGITEMIEKLKSVVSNMDHSGNMAKEITTHTLQIEYLSGSEDVKSLCKNLQLAENELFDLHMSQTFTIEFYGFLPGFPYLSGLPTRLHHPRKSSVTKNIAKGSVAVANEMCGIYPVVSPGGWHVIGQLKRGFFDATEEVPTILMPGDKVKFTPN